LFDWKRKIGHLRRKKCRDDEKEETDERERRGWIGRWTRLWTKAVKECEIKERERERDEWSGTSK
jgi:hypothetical protein